MIQLLIIALVLFVLAFIIALYSMRDFEIVSYLRKSIERKKKRGSIVFFNDRVEHYHSSSSPSSSN